MTRDGVLFLEVCGSLLEMPMAYVSKESATADYDLSS